MLSFKNKNLFFIILLIFGLWYFSYLGFSGGQFAYYYINSATTTGNGYSCGVYPQGSYTCESGSGCMLLSTPNTASQYGMTSCYPLKWHYIGDSQFCYISVGNGDTYDYSGTKYCMADSSHNALDVYNQVYGSSTTPLGGGSSDNQNTNVIIDNFKPNKQVISMANYISSAITNFFIYIKSFLGGL